MNKKLVIANWKMHGNQAANARLIAGLLPTLEGLDSVQVAICPPTPYLAQLTRLLADAGVALGAQNLSERAQGAYTGEVSGQMLADLGCSYVLVGHSERRSLFGETDAQVAMKFEAALAAGLTPVLCLGESIHQRRAGNTNAVVGSQLKAVLDQVGIEQLAKGVIAYEPVWAIGTGASASPEQAQQAHLHIRQLLAARAPGLAPSIALIYGGSVNAVNAAALFAQHDIDGGLIGGAALDAACFSAICQAADTTGALPVSADNTYNKDPA